MAQQFMFLMFYVSQNPTPAVHCYFLKYNLLVLKFFTLTRKLYEDFMRIFSFSYTDWIKYFITHRFISKVSYSDHIKNSYWKGWLLLNIKPANSYSSLFVRLFNCIANGLHAPYYLLTILISWVILSFC